MPSVDNALLEAISDATPQRLKDLMVTICGQNTDALGFLKKELLVPVDELPSVESDRRKSEAGKKRKVTARTEHCVQCDEPYEVLENHPEACRWHNGWLEVDYQSDIWADHDERCHGTIDSDAMREDHPEGFVWDCCDVQGDEEGEECQIGPHRPASKVQKHGA